MLAPRLNHRVWVPSLYLGGFVVVLGLGGIGFRGGPAWRGWLSGVAAISLVGSFGVFASPLLVARFVPAIERAVGPHDPSNSSAIRLDGYLRDGDGSLYCVMTQVLPGFGQFRFPSKLLSFTALAIAGLAGVGWDRAAGGGSKRVARLAWIGAGLSLATLAAPRSRSKGG